MITCERYHAVLRGSGNAGLYFVVNDADAMLEVCRAAAATVVEPIADRQYGLRDFSIEDRDGYILTFGHRLKDE